MTLQASALGLPVASPTHRTWRGAGCKDREAIHPFSEAGDDDPRNGLALTPSMHWAMDRNLIAPGPDYRWHVSSLIDTRIADFAPLLAIEGKEVLKPKDRRMWPKAEALTWRLDRLREPDWVAASNVRATP